MIRNCLTLKFYYSLQYNSVVTFAARAQLTTVYTLTSVFVSTCGMNVAMNVISYQRTHFN
jgi:hypothetical protein